MEFSLDRISEWVSDESVRCVSQAVYRTELRYVILMHYASQNVVDSDCGRYS